MCGIHYYAKKEQILQAAWRKGSLTFDVALIQLYPGLLKRMLHMRCLMRPLLDKIRESNATSNCHFQFHLIIKKAHRTLILRSTEEASDLF